MATKVFWYTSVIDGRTPWVAHGRYQFDFHRLRRHVNLLDRRGFYGSLFGTYGHDIWTLASALISETQVHRFLLPIYPGLDSPTALAQRASTFDDITGGRLIFNVVNGTDSSSAAYGIRIPRDERYGWPRVLESVQEGLPRPADHRARPVLRPEPVRHDTAPSITSDGGSNPETSYSAVGRGELRRGQRPRGKTLRSPSHLLG